MISSSAAASRKIGVLSPVELLVPMLCCEAAPNMSVTGAVASPSNELLDDCVGAVSHHATKSAGASMSADAGVSPPEVGLELADSKGRAVADCELAWSDSQLAILRADQEDLQEHWVTDGWKCLVLDEDMAMAQGKPWEVVAAEYLGIEVKLDEGVAA